MIKECPKCGHKIESEASTSCPSCGVVFAKYHDYLRKKIALEEAAKKQKIEQKAQPPKPRPSEPQLTPKQAKNLFPCGSCGAPVSHSAKACPKCGHRITSRFTLGCLWIIAVSAVFTVISVNLAPDKTASTTTQATTSDTNVIPDDGKQPQRLAFIEKLITNGFYLKVENSGLLPHAYVGPTFWQVDVDTKIQMLDATLTYYVIADSEASILILKDGMTGKRIGKFDEYGLDLD